MNGKTNEPGKVVVRRMDEVPAVPIAEAPDAAMQVILGPDEGAPNFVLRRFTLKPGGKVQRHVHDVLEHEQVILEGEMVVRWEGGELFVKTGEAVFIPAGVAHAYENRGETPVKFLCTVPKVEHRTEWLE